MKQCKCGKALKTKYEYCPYCGKRYEEEPIKIALMVNGDTQYVQLISTNDIMNNGGIAYHKFYAPVVTDSCYIVIKTQISVERKEG